MTERRIEGMGRLFAIAILMIGCLVVVQPFLAASLFAATLCLSTWPVHVWLRRKVGGYRAIAAILMTLLLVLACLFPFAVIAPALVDDVPKVIAWVRGLVAAGPPEPPTWLVGLPLVGEHIETYWQHVAASREELQTLAARFIEPTRTFLLAIGGALGQGILQLSLAMFIAFFLYRDGEDIVRTLRTVAYRLAGDFAMPVLSTISNTVVGVMYAIVGTALVQSIVAAMGFWIAGVPAVLLLGAATFLLSVIPFGAPVVSIGVAVWLFQHDSIGWAVFTLTWGILVVANIDNFLKPLLVSRGAAMPFVLVLLGMFGGVLAFGFIGIFLGPALLAVAYSLTRTWIGIDAPVVPPELTTIVKDDREHP